MAWCNLQASASTMMWRSIYSALLISLCACGGGGGGGGGGTNDQPEPPPVGLPAFSLEWVYPAGPALTPAVTIDVLLNLDVLSTTIDAVFLEVGAQRIAAVNQGADLWRAEDIPLSPGPNEIRVRGRDSGGDEVVYGSLSVTSQSVFTAPNSLAIDAAGAQLYFVDAGQGALFRVDAGTEQVEQLLSLPNSQQLLADLSFDRQGRLLILQGPELARLDLSTQSLQTIFRANVGLLPPLFSALAVDTAADVAYLLDPTGRLLSLDLTLPEPPAEVVSAGLGEPLPLTDLTLDVTNQQAFALGFDGAVVRFDLQSGEADLLVASNAGPSKISGVYDAASGSVIYATAEGELRSLAVLDMTDTSLSATSSVGGGPVALTDNAIWLLSPASSRLLRFDRDDRSVRVVVSSEVGNGPLVGAVLGAQTRGRGLVLHGGANLVGLRQGQRDVLSQLPALAPFGTLLPGLTVPGGLALSNDTNVAWPVSLNGKMLWRVDLLDNSQRSVLDLTSDASAGAITGVTVSEDGSTAYLALVSNTANRVLRVQTDTGATETLWTEALSSFNFAVVGRRLRGLVLDASGNRLILDFLAFLSPFSDGSEGPGLVSLDLGSGQLSDLAPFPALTNLVFAPYQASLSFDQEHVLTPSDDLSLGLVASTSLADGTITYISDRQANGPLPGRAAAAVEGPDGQLFVLDINGAVLQIDQRTGERVLISR